MSDDFLGNPHNKTELWLKNSPSIRHRLPKYCPTCGDVLTANYAYIGVFPYLHAGINLRCKASSTHEFTFCLPFDKAAAEGYTVFDSADSKRYSTERVCPFHAETKLQPVRLYGDLVFNDGTRKLQLRCPVCNFSERVTFQK